MADEEIELKFTEIDKERVRSQLQGLPASKAWSKTLRTVAFDGRDISSTDSTQRYLRVRDYEGTAKVTFKEPVKDEHTPGRHELEFTVSDPSEAIELFKRLGLDASPVTEKHREKWQIGDTEVVIDTIQGKPPYMEVEAPSRETLHDVASRLGLDPAEGSPLSIIELHPEYFD